MTGLMNSVRRAGVRRFTSIVVCATVVLALAGCDDDRATDANERQPIAVTASGIAIMEVARDEHARTVEAVVVTGGEERQVTLAPFLDGPLPSGFTATVNVARGEVPTEVAYGWDQSTGATFFRQRTGRDTFDLSLGAVQGRVVEEYAFNGQSVRLEYADLAPVVLNEVVDRYLRGDAMTDASAEVVEFVGELREFEAFAAQVPNAAAPDTEDGALLKSLLGDPTFASLVAGGEQTTAARPDGLCRFFNTCAAVACKLVGTSHICTVCLAGSLACAFMDLMCSMWCGG